MNEEKKAARHPTGRIERRNIPEHEAAWEGRRHLTRPPSQSESESPSEPESSEPRGRLAGLRASPAGGTHPPPPRGVVAGGIAGGEGTGGRGGSEKPKRRWGRWELQNFRNSRGVGPRENGAGFIGPNPAGVSSPLKFLWV